MFNATIQYFTVQLPKCAVFLLQHWATGSSSFDSIDIGSFGIGIGIFGVGIGSISIDSFSFGSFGIGVQHWDFVKDTTELIYISKDMKIYSGTGL